MQAIFSIPLEDLNSKANAEYSQDLQTHLTREEFNDILDSINKHTKLSLSKYRIIFTGLTIPIILYFVIYSLIYFIPLGIYGLPVSTTCFGINCTIFVVRVMGNRSDLHKQFMYHIGDVNRKYKDRFHLQLDRKSNFYTISLYKESNAENSQQEIEPVRDLGEGPSVQEI